MFKVIQNKHKQNTTNIVNFSLQYITFTLGVGEGFFGYISPKHEEIWMKPAI